MEKNKCYESLEALPRELVDVCLNCTRPRCIGKCPRYEEAARKYRTENGRSVFVRNMTGIRTGYEPQRYELYGEMVTVREVNEKYGISNTTIRRYLKEGLSMQEVIENHGRRKKHRD